jgi:hypothetical protein
MADKANARHREGVPEAGAQGKEITVRIAWRLSSIPKRREMLVPKAQVECGRTENQW